jgi:hypothetical protein
MRAPAGISTLYTMNGDQLVVRSDGTIEVGGDEVRSLIVAGWRVIELPGP